MYRNVAQIDSATQILSLWFPQVFTRVQLPEPSVQGRPVYALRMRAGGGGARRGVLIVGGTHAREMMNPDAIIELAIDLFLSYSNGTGLSYGGRTWSADDIELILEALDIWLVPCVNPDGREYVIGVDNMWRKNRRVNAGTACVGADLNRNADIVWGVAQGQTSCSPCTDIYCGPSAFSEPETRNVKYLLDTERMVSFVDVHSYSELVLFPWGHARTQSTDPTQRFTGLATGTCTPSIPASYSEYMPAQDVQRFTTVAARIVADIAAVRGRRYTPETAFTLYGTTGTQSDYAYSRHIANPALYKTYGFTFETGPFVNNSSDSFHPADPTLVKRDAKAGMLGLLQQSVCAIELIGIKLFEGEAEVTTLRSVRDDLLATTAAGRAWIALFERAQFATLTAVMRDPHLMKEAADVISAAAKAIANGGSIFNETDATRASRLVKKLKSKTKIRSLRADLSAVGAQIEKMSGRRMQQVIESLLRKKPVLGSEPHKPVKSVAAKSPRSRRG
jgi:murein tripeptide amidase MpaA